MVIQPTHLLKDCYSQQGSNSHDLEVLPPKWLDWHTTTPCLHYTSILQVVLKDHNKKTVYNSAKCKLFGLTLFKVCVHYIFASMIFMSNREHLWNKEECFLFHFESSFRFWGNQILTFQIFKCHDVSNAQTWNTRHILLNNLGSRHSLVMKFGQFMQYYKTKFFIKKFCETFVWKLVPGLF